MTQPADRPPLLPHMMILVPIGISLGLAVIVWIAPLNDGRRIQAIWTMCAFLVGSGATMLMRHFELNKTVADLARSVAEARQSSENTIQQNARLMRIETALREPAQFDRVARLNEVIGQIHESRLHHPALNDLIRWRADRLFDRALRAHTDLSDGLVIIDDENKELNTNETLLRTLAAREIKAVSFEDEPFWGSPEGEEFLKAHADIIASKNIKIRRLFVLEHAVDHYRDTLCKQIGVGVEVKTITREKALKVRLEDFVLYDDHFMRRGFRPTDGEYHDTMVKYASVTWEKKRLEPYIDAFDSLWKQGVRFDGASQ